MIIKILSKTIITVREAITLCVCFTIVYTEYMIVIHNRIYQYNYVWFDRIELSSIPYFHLYAYINNINDYSEN